MPSTIDTWNTSELSEDWLTTLPGNSLADNASYKDKCTREPTRVAKISFCGAMLAVPCTDIRDECDLQGAALLKLMSVGGKGGRQAVPHEEWACLDAVGLPCAVPAALLKCFASVRLSIVDMLRSASLTLFAVVKDALLRDGHTFAIVDPTMVLEMTFLREVAEADPTRAIQAKLGEAWQSLAQATTVKQDLKALLTPHATRIVVGGQLSARKELEMVIGAIYRYRIDGILKDSFGCAFLTLVRQWVTFFSEAAVPKAKGIKGPPTLLQALAAVTRLVSECEDEFDNDKNAVLLKDVDEVQRFRQELDDTQAKLLHEMVTHAVGNSRLSPSGGGASSSAASSPVGPLHAEKAKTIARGSKKNMKTDADVDFKDWVQALFGFPSGGPHAVS